VRLGVLVVAGSVASVGVLPASAIAAKKLKLSGEITVSAAASLTEAFTKIGTNFQKANKGTTITFNFGSSGTLEQQIEQGAPVDVFASADWTNMDKLVSMGKIVTTPVTFARNKLEIAVKPGNPKNVTGLTSLPTVGIVSLCALTVPCGKYANDVLTRANVTIPPDKITRGQDVKATLAAVSPGDADAGIVYQTDVQSAGSAVKGIVIPDDQNTIALYPISPLAAASNKSLSRAFSRYVASAKGQKVLLSYGFLPVVT
jgi:molybdate transport system substrate-binding protein